jgi:hypothetical protein
LALAAAVLTGDEETAEDDGDAAVRARLARSDAITGAEDAGREDALKNK